MTCRQFMSVAWFLVGLLGVVGQSDGKEEESPPPLVLALEHLQRGRYEEAEESFEQLPTGSEIGEPDRIAAFFGHSRVLEETGRWDEADQLISTALMEYPTSPVLLARRGELDLRRGRYAQARRSAEAGIAQDSQHVHSRLVLAHALAETGELDEAAKAYRWFVMYYNRSAPTDAQTLVWVGEGSAQYARWNHVSSIFKFVVNEVCPDALKNDKNWWQASLLSGSLLLEKYNDSQAIPEFHNALQVNPQNAEVHAAIGNAFLQDYKLEQARSRAEQALELNSRSPAALMLMADVLLMSDQPQGADEWLDKALLINPVDQRILGRKAGLALLQERLLTRQKLEAGLIRFPEMSVDSSLPVAFQESVARAIAVNPRCGELLSAMGAVLEAHRKFELAEICYRKAIEVMPQLTTPRTQLGMLCMRTGQIEEAEKILNEAFEADPFHVRISNMRKVIGVLKAYDTISTEHFVIRIDHDQRLLGQAMADYLEQSYPEMTKFFGYEPPQRTQFEIYCDAKGQSAHAWFSSRMIGLPWIQTIGASTGVMVALASPGQTQNKYHWGRVLRHEFSHVLTLQATQFNIPHWYTEALAVRIEGSAFPPAWEELLLERQPAGKLFNLDTINDGFRKPQGPDDWTLAYCQATLYANFIEKKYGPEANPRLLTAYREGKTTAEALQQLFQIEQPQFEAEYNTFLAELVQSFSSGRSPKLPDLKTAEANYKAHTEDLQCADEYALALLKTRRGPQARKIAEAVLAKDPNRPLSNVVIAMMDARKRRDEVQQQLLALRDQGVQHREVLVLLCTLAGQGKDWQTVWETSQLGRKLYPRDAFFVSAAGQSCEELGLSNELMASLESMALFNQDDPAARRKLAKLMLASGDPQAARKWATDSLLIDFMSVETHEALGQSCLALQDWEAAERAFEHAIEIQPDRIDSSLGLVETWARSEQNDKARTLIEQILKTHPDHAAALALKVKLAL